MIRLLLALLSLAAAPAPTTPLHVTRILDGDTIEVASDDGPLIVRVLGIDCPESHANAKCRRDERAGRGACLDRLPLGRADAARAHELLDGRDVTLEPRKPGRRLGHHYKRTLAYVRLSDGRDYGLEMVRAGLCEDFGWRYPHPRGAAYVAAAGGTK